MLAPLPSPRGAAPITLHALRTSRTTDQNTDQRMTASNETVGDCYKVAFETLLELSQMVETGLAADKGLDPNPTISGSRHHRAPSRTCQR